MSEVIRETLQPTREWIDGKAYHVHVSRDGKIRINTWLDDQRPDHDGEKFFQPICVAQYLGGSDSLYSYVYYCGRCRKRMGQTRERSPRCGAGIAHYVFAMGTVDWKPPTWNLNDELPDRLPDFIDATTPLLKS